MNKLILFAIILKLSQCDYSEAPLQQELCVSIDNNHQSFVVGLDNVLDVYYFQDEPITKENISAELIHHSTKSIREIEIIESNGHLIVRPDSLGHIKLSVQTDDGVKEKVIRVESIIPKSRMAIYGANHDGKINAREFRIQPGLRAEVIGYDMKASCNVVTYEVIRLNDDDSIQRHINQGGRFDEEARAIIQKAIAGDMYIFRNILYRCPGDDEPKRLEDMIFEIK